MTSSKLRPCLSKQPFKTFRQLLINSQLSLNQQNKLVFVRSVEQINLLVFYLMASYILNKSVIKTFTSFF